MPLAADLALTQPPHAVVITATTTWKSVTVKPGDSVWALAMAHGTTVDALVSKNQLPRGGSLIHPGQKLLVPGKAAAPTPAKPAPKPAAKPAPQPATATTYTVRAGDSLSGIAAKHRVSLAALVSANRITNPNLIFPGQRIQIPGTAAAQPAAKPAPKPATPAPKPEAKPAPKPEAQPAPQPATPATTTYTVQPGDTLSAIAAKHGVTLAAVIAANDLADPGMIYPGQKISVPGGKTTTPAPAPNSENTFAGYTYPDSTVNAAKANREALAARSVPSPAETAAIIRRIATQHGVDPKLALAIGWLESGHNQRAVSVANAIGTMQVIPMSGEWASDLAGRKLDLLDVEDNITAGVVIIKALLHSAEDREQAIAGYYQGLHSVKTNGMYKDTKSYVANVLAIYERM